MANLIEAKEHKQMVIRVLRKTKPASFRGKPNTDGITFIDAVNVETGEPLEKPITITESRARMLGMDQLLVGSTATKASRTVNTVDANGKSHQEVIEQLEENLVAKKIDLVLEVDMIVVGDNSGYRINRDAVIDGVPYKAGNLVPYRSVNTLVINKVMRELDANKFVSQVAEKYNAKVAFEIQLSQVHEKIRIITGKPYDENDERHQELMTRLLS